MNLGFLGLIHKAGRIALGRTSLDLALDKGAVRLIITAEDLSPRFKDDIKRKAESSGISIIEWLTKKQWGKIFGRDSVGVFGILDKKVAGKVLEGVHANG